MIVVGSDAVEPAVGMSELTGDVTAGPGVGPETATIANNAITNAKLVDVPTATFKGRTAAGVGDPQDLTVAQATALLNLATAVLKGLLSPADFNKLATVNTGDGIPSVIVSPTVDWVAGTDVIIVPAHAGYLWVPIQYRFFVTQASGTYSGLATQKAGNNGSNDNAMASTANVPTAAAFTAAAAGAVPLYSSTGVTPTNVQLLDLSTAVTMKITTPGTGAGLVLKGYVVSIGQKVPVASLA